MCKMSLKLVVSLRDVRMDWQKHKSLFQTAVLSQLQQYTSPFFHVRDFSVCIGWLYSLGKLRDLMGKLGGKNHYLTQRDNVV